MGESDLHPAIQAMLQAKEQKKLQKTTSKALKSKSGSTSYKPIVDSKPGEERPVNYAIAKNKGLTPRRSKECKNPRVKQRKKYERAKKRLGSFKAVAKENPGKYIGETTGIRKTLTRSVRYT